MAGFVLEDEMDSTGRVVAFAAGTKCASGDTVRQDGSILRDSHAEVRDSSSFALQTQLGFGAPCLD